MADQSLTNWIVGVVAGGLLTLLGFLLRWAVSNLLARMDIQEQRQEALGEKIIQRLETLGDKINDHERRLSLGSQTFSDTRAELDRLTRTLDMLKERYLIALEKLEQRREG